jgi:prophage DNA circulation protein
LSTPTTNALNVAGSIGGVAQAASSLASLFGGAAGTWAASLKTASYGGVPFGIDAVRTIAGRRTAVHDYPFRDESWIEDLGKKNRQFDVSGFLVENDLITQQGGVVGQRDALLAACEKAGGQTLVHPTLGTVQNVCCLSVETIERKDLGLVFEIRLSLQVSGNRLFPTAITSTGDASAANANLTGIAALLNFAKSAASAIQLGAAVVQQGVSTVVGWYQIAVTAVNDVKRVIGSVSTLFGNFGRLFGGANNGYAGANVRALPSVTADDLLSQATANRNLVMQAGAALQIAAANPGDSADLGTAVQGLISAVAASAVDPADAVRMVGMLADAGYDAGPDRRGDARDADSDVCAVAPLRARATRRDAHDLSAVFAARCR